MFNEKFVFGASYRFGNAVSALAGFQVSDPIYFGVSYDYSTNGLGAYNSGTPEVVLRFQIGRTGGSSKRGKTNNLKKDPKQIDTPRFF